jgi:UDP-glucose 4-epimerase
VLANDSRPSRSWGGVPGLLELESAGGRNSIHRRALVTGGAGFIGSHLVEELVSRDVGVTLLDNLSAGVLPDTVASLVSGGKVRFIRGDCTSEEVVRASLRDIDTVFHFAANPEVRLEFNDPENCFRQNILATHVLLNSARRSTVSTFVFASSSTVYGDATVLPTPEDYGPLLPISVYGASKLASEALVSSHCQSFGVKGVILRFANIVGPRAARGVIHDFVKKLLNHPVSLEVLGDGSQSKSYLFIDDCIQGIARALAASGDGISLYNVGNSDMIDVTEIARVVMEEEGLTNTQVAYTKGVQGGRGWVGDVKTMLLDNRKLLQTGWRPTLSSREAVRRTTRLLLDQASKGLRHRHPHE